MKLRAVLPPLKDIYGYTQKSNGVASLQAIESRFLALIAQLMGFSYELMLPVDGQFGFMEQNGNWTGIIGMIQRDEADLSVAYLAMTYQRMQAIHFSESYWTQDQSFMTELPSLLPKTYFFTYPFHWSVWLGYLSVMFFVSIFMLFLRHEDCTFGRVLMTVFSGLCRQPYTIKRPTFCLKLVFGHWLCFSNFVTLSYCAVLLSFLTVPLREKGVETIEDLCRAVKDGSYKALVPLGSSILEHLITSDHPRLQVLGKTILTNHWAYDTREGITDYFQYGTALIGPKMRFRGLTFSRRFISEDSFGIWNVGIALNKRFCCKPRLDKLLRRALGAGLYQKIVEDEGFKAGLGHESVRHQQGVHSRSLGTEDLYGVFALLVVGYLVSCLALIGELFWNRISAKVRNGGVDNREQVCVDTSQEVNRSWIRFFLSQFQFSYHKSMFLK